MPIINCLNEPSKLAQVLPKNNTPTTRGGLVKRQDIEEFQRLAVFYKIYNREEPLIKRQFFLLMRIESFNKDFKFLFHSLCTAGKQLHRLHGILRRNALIKRSFTSTSDGCSPEMRETMTSLYNHACSQIQKTKKFLLEIYQVKSKIGSLFLERNRQFNSDNAAFLDGIISLKSMELHRLRQVEEARYYLTTAHKSKIP